MINYQRWSFGTKIISMVQKHLLPSMGSSTLLCSLEKLWSSLVSSTCLQSLNSARPASISRRKFVADHLAWNLIRVAPCSQPMHIMAFTKLMWKQVCKIIILSLISKIIWLFCSFRDKSAISIAWGWNQRQETQIVQLNRRRIDRRDLLDRFQHRICIEGWRVRLVGRRVWTVSKY